ncbi:hypothetical protein Hbl1158_10160 [Halobaculum sp. CBA1158]|uniref:hypothetical protein n=1 Tax=Halobaculum sp. CBA1158 TaxID=2904243 RepID=UPI001F17F7CE|nr:hypothetical protein [Halobaculum sp. CBA1158]UIO98897.1 hypothetical protein Hbl1158_10160 [Halobaculum sp. CBA1158]
MSDDSPGPDVSELMDDADVSDERREGFREGFRTAMKIVHSASGTYLAALETGAAGGEEEPDESRCDDCGDELVDGMGGPICPTCDL